MENQFYFAEPALHGGSLYRVHYRPVQGRGRGHQQVLGGQGGGDGGGVGGRLQLLVLLGPVNGGQVLGVG